MIKFLDIRPLWRLLTIVLAALFLLSACSDDADSKKNGPFNTGKSGEIAATNAEEASKADEAKEDCWQGKVLKQVYDVVGKLILVQYNNLTKGSLAVMSIAFAIWLALRLLKFVSSVTEASPAEIWNEIIKKAFICLFCGYLASTASLSLMFINVFLVPIYTAFLEFGSRIISLTQKEVESVTLFGEQIKFVMNNISCSFPADATIAIENSLPSEFQETMSCMICAVVDKLRLGRQLAFKAMAMNGFLPLLIGIAVWAIFYIVGFAFVFYLVDSIFRLGMMLLMLPLFIMSYAFGPTKKWAGIGFTNIMYSAAFMMAFSIIVAMTILAIVEFIQNNQALFNPSDVEKEVTQIGVVNLTILLIGFLALGSMGVAQGLTKSIIGGGVESKFQQNLKAVAGWIKNIILGAGSMALKKSGFYENTGLGRGLKAGSDLKRKLDELAGRH